MYIKGSALDIFLRVLIWINYEVYYGLLFGSFLQLIIWEDDFCGSSLELHDIKGCLNDHIEATVTNTESARYHCGSFSVNLFA